ncbi:hypothetical protein BDR22DRAFT_825264 [Usnea florida]
MRSRRCEERWEMSGRIPNDLCVGPRNASPFNHDQLCDIALLKVKSPSSSIQQRGLRHVQRRRRRSLDYPNDPCASLDLSPSAGSRRAYDLVDEDSGRRERRERSPINWSVRNGAIGSRAEISAWIGIMVAGMSGVERVLTSFSVGEEQAKRLTYFSVIYGLVSVIFGLQTFLLLMTSNSPPDETFNTKYIEISGKTQSKGACDCKGWLTN